MRPPPFLPGTGSQTQCRTPAAAGPPADDHGRSCPVCVYLDRPQPSLIEAYWGMRTSPLPVPGRGTKDAVLTARTCNSGGVADVEDANSPLGPFFDDLRVGPPALRRAEWFHCTPVPPAAQQPRVNEGTPSAEMRRTRENAAADQRTGDSRHGLQLLHGTERPARPLRATNDA
jgi:hypothetical protein